MILTLNVRTIAGDCSSKRPCLSYISFFSLLQHTEIIFRDDSFILGNDHNFIMLILSTLFLFINTLRDLYSMLLRVGLKLTYEGPPPALKNLLLG